MTRNRNNGYLPSAELVDESPCALFDHDHAIATDIAEVLYTLDEQLEHAHVGAAGCGTCHLADVPDLWGYIYHIAQRPETADTVDIHYNINNRNEGPLNQKQLGRVICHVASQLGVGVDWDGETWRTITLHSRTGV